MSNLKLITTENFGDLQCNFYRNMNDDILLTREQIGTALEYSNPSTAIKNIHRKHRDRLDPLSIRIKLGGYQNEPPSKSEEQECIYYTQRGIMEICRFSRQPLANLFMDWVWDIVERYRNNEINQPLDVQPVLDAMNKLADTVDSTMVLFNERLSKLEKSTQDKIKDKPELPTYKKPYNPWFAKMQPKYKLLEEYFSVTRGALYKNILMEMENLYDIDTQQICADYLYEKNLPSCYPLEPYEFEPKYRDMIEQIVNSNLIKHNIVSEDDPIASMKHVTIFDQTV